MDFLPIILFWISIALSIVLSMIGIVKSKSWLLVGGAILFLPFVYYFGGSPTTRIVIVLPLLQLASAYAVSRDNKFLAWSLFSPVIFFILFVLGIVLVN